MREKRDDTPDSPENFTLPYQKCLCNACKIWLKQKFCLRAREAFFGFILVGFAQVSMTLMKLKGGQQRRLQSGSAVLRLQAKRPGAQMAFMTIMGWRHIQWKSNLSSYRKKKKKSIWMWVCSQHETVWINNGNGPVTKESAGASSRCQGRISSPSWPLEGGKNNRL